MICSHDLSSYRNYNFYYLIYLIFLDMDVMNVDKRHLLINSVTCHCPSTEYAVVDISIAWARASRNAHTLLADLAAGSNGFIEWNLM